MSQWLYISYLSDECKNDHWVTLNSNQEDLKNKKPQKVQPRVFADGCSDALSHVRVSGTGSPKRSHMRPAKEAG